MGTTRIIASLLDAWHVLSQKSDLVLASTPTPQTYEIDGILFFLL